MVASHNQGAASARRGLADRHPQETFMCNGLSAKVVKMFHRHSSEDVAEGRGSGVNGDITVMGRSIKFTLAETSPKVDLQITK